MLILFDLDNFSLEELGEASKALNDVMEIDLPAMMEDKKKTSKEVPCDAEPCDRCGRYLT